MTKDKQTHLYRYHKDAVTLADLLKAFSHWPNDDPLQGFIQTPRDLVWFNPSETTGLDQAYEARLFCEKGELRWLRDPDDASGKGRAAWLSEEAKVPEGFNKIEDDRFSTLTTRNSQVLAQPENRDGIEHYKIREYIGSAPGSAGEDGNLVVLEQRLLASVRRDGKANPL